MGILAWFVVSTVMETICLAYAVFAYEGTYIKEGRMQHFPLEPHVSLIVDCCWFFSLPIVGFMQPRSPNLRYHYRLSNDSEGPNSGDCDTKPSKPISKAQVIGHMAQGSE